MAWVEGLHEIITRFGGHVTHEEIRAAVIRAHAQAQSNASTTMSGVEVLRIRLSKFVASRIPADVYADRLQHAEIRQAIRTLIEDVEGPTQPDPFPTK